MEGGGERSENKDGDRAGVGGRGGCGATRRPDPLRRRRRERGCGVSAAARGQRERAAPLTLRRGARRHPLLRAGRPRCPAPRRLAEAARPGPAGPVPAGVGAGAGAGAGSGSGPGPGGRGPAAAAALGEAAGPGLPWLRRPGRRPVAAGGGGRPRRAARQEVATGGRGSEAAGRRRRRRGKLEERLYPVLCCTVCLGPAQGLRCHRAAGSTPTRLRPQPRRGRPPGTASPRRPGRSPGGPEVGLWRLFGSSFLVLWQLFCFLFGTPFFSSFVTAFIP